MDGITLRATTPRDLRFVRHAEEDRTNRPFIVAWNRKQHAAALADPDFGHSIIEDAAGNRVGFVILAGLTNPHGSVELRRIVVTTKRKGVGRAAVRLVEHVVFRQRHAHRLWLDVKERNNRARALYDAEGFVAEGVLRECLKGARGYESLVLMSMLAFEYYALGRRAMDRAPRR